MSDILCCLVPIALLAVLPFPVIWVRRRLSMRGLKSRFEMDGAVCLEPEQGNVVIRRKKVRSVLLLVFLGLAGVGILLLIPFFIQDRVIADLLAGEFRFSEVWEAALAIPFALIFIGGAVISLVRSLSLSAIIFDRQDRVLIVGRGESERRIPFSDLSSVTIEPSQTGAGGLEVEVVRQDGERIALGTLSGPGAAERADGIANLVERVTGAQAVHT